MTLNYEAHNRAEEQLRDAIDHQETGQEEVDQDHEDQGDQHWDDQHRLLPVKEGRGDQEKGPRQAEQGEGEGRQLDDVGGAVEVALAVVDHVEGLLDDHQAEDGHIVEADQERAGAQVQTTAAFSQERHL